MCSMFLLECMWSLSGEFPYFWEVKNCSLESFWILCVCVYFMVLMCETVSAWNHCPAQIFHCWIQLCSPCFPSFLLPHLYVLSAPWHLSPQIPLIFPSSHFTPSSKLLSLSADIQRSTRGNSASRRWRTFCAVSPRRIMRSSNMSSATWTSEWDGLWQPCWLHRRPPSHMTLR